MSRLARSENPCVAIEIVIPFHGTDDIRINDRARGAVPTAVGIAIGSGEEYHLMVLSDDDKGNCGFKA